MQLQTVIFYGRSGSGKGTQADLLKVYLEKHDSSRDVIYIETGNGLRSLAKRKKYTSTLVREVLDSGGLIPVFLPIWIWTSFLIEHFTGDEHLIFDGIARRSLESPVVDSALEFYGRKNPVVIHLNVSRTWAFDRLKARKRHDDTDQDINNRLDWYDTNVVPALNYYRNNKRFIFMDIDGEQEIETVHKDVLSALKFK